MGMFDSLYISPKLLPVSEEERKRIGADHEFQTKNFDCQLTRIDITNDGLLTRELFEYEAVPKEERPHPEGDGLMGMMGSLKRVNERKEIMIDFHGWVNFYSSIGQDWYEFNAKFTDGKLQKIEGGCENRMNTLLKQLK